MKKLVLGITILLSQIALAQVTKETGSFESVKVFDKINLQLIPSSENKIELFGFNSESVEVINKNGELKIRMPLSNALAGDDVKAKLYFKNIQSIDATEGSFVSSNEVFEQMALELTAREGAQIELKSDVKKAKVRVITGSRINLSGKAVNQEASVGTGGILEARDLATEQTTVSIVTGGEADVYAKEFVDAQVKMGGTITIFGKPKQINQKTVLGGSIIQSN